MSHGLRMHSTLFEGGRASQPCTGLKHQRNPSNPNLPPDSSFPFQGVRPLKDELCPPDFSSSRFNFNLSIDILQHPTLFCAFINLLVQLIIVSYLFSFSVNNHNHHDHQCSLSALNLWTHVNLCQGRLVELARYRQPIL